MSLSWDPVLALAPAPLYATRLKRLLDLCIALALLPLALPLVALAAACIAAGGGAPFYGHVRIGRGGRAFRCWKLRTMRVDGDAILARHLAADPAARAEWQSTRKLRHDPRVTPLGHLFRVTSIDELPQLLNVLRGEMSLVGPRPVTGAELARYGRDAEAYLALLPGITGAWQVAGRNALTLTQRIAHDADYARRISFRTDLAILVRTGRAVLGGGG
ncbi:sugar transferase [Halovulum dunhuangense]|uniref:Sugar transferase n=1 Tax=Halovulum dunhuangense TaxID=1505036 RepID=A0A849L038_9RHOB|nr:sugar transferase [Halovulum dunhuangense]NNU79060.1 sugar transferase [Halovulum dunhuangense]